MLRNLDIHVMRRVSIPPGSEAFFAGAWEACAQSIPMAFDEYPASGTFYKGRKNAYLSGSAGYVSHVNDDDLVLGNPYTKALELLDSDESLVGVHVNSYVDVGGVRTPMFSHRQWSVEHHVRCPLPVHELNVMRRSAVEKAIPIIDAAIAADPSVEIEGEQLFYAAVARFGRWVFLPDTFGYVWRKHKFGGHNYTHKNRLNHWTRMKLRKHLMGLQP